MKQTAAAYITPCTVTCAWGIFLAMTSSMQLQRDQPLWLLHLKGILTPGGPGGGGAAAPGTGTVKEADAPPELQTQAWNGVSSAPPVQLSRHVTGCRHAHLWVLPVALPRTRCST